MTEGTFIWPHPKDLESAKRELMWFQDREVVKYSEIRHGTHDIYTQEEYYRSIPLSDYFYQIKFNDLHVGNLRAIVDWPNRVANMSILIGDRGVWKKGIGFEAWALFSKLLLLNSIRKIEAGCMAENIAMVNLARSSGMKLEGKIPDHFLLDKRPVDLLLFGRCA